MKGSRPCRAWRPAAAISLLAVVLLLSACANAVGQSPAGPPASLGPGEGALRLLGTTGYVEDGHPDPRVDWVTAFEHQTGCRVNYTQVPDGSAIPREFRSHRFDGVVAPPVVAAQLISAGSIAPLNVQLIDGYSAISPALRSQQAQAAQAAVTSHRTIYGMPYLWTSYLLGYRTQAVRPGPRTWAALFDHRQAARYAGEIMLPDTPFTIGLAALYLKTARPALRITDPYELTRQQFAAATSLLRSGRNSATAYYSQDPQVIAGLASGSSVLGAVLPRHVDTLARARTKVAGADPAQGTTGSANFWLMNARSPHPNCMYEWLAWSITPRVQEQAAAWNGAAPVNPAACDGLGRRICGLRHVDDHAYLSKVAFAHMPGPTCSNGARGCVGWAAWANAWTSIVRTTPG